MDNEPGGIAGNPGNIPPSSLSTLPSWVMFVVQALTRFKKKQIKSLKTLVCHSLGLPDFLPVTEEHLFPVTAKAEHLPLLLQGLCCSYLELIFTVSF